MQHLKREFLYAHTTYIHTCYHMQIYHSYQVDVMRNGILFFIIINCFLDLKSCSLAFNTYCQIFKIIINIFGHVIELALYSLTTFIKT